MPVSITAQNVPVTQNFDTLANTAGSTTNSTLPNSWVITETGGGARDNEQYAVDTGGSNTGDTFSYGSAGSTERALGSLQSGTLIATFGASFTNDTGSTITSLLISYFGEQWRLGTAGRADRLDFQISFDATSLTTGTWTDVDALDFSSAITTGALGLLDGNAAANRTAISSTISGISIAAGATFWIRWIDLNASGADDGLAIDDFSLTAQGSASAAGALSIDSVSANEGNSGTTNITFTVTRSGGSTGAVSATWNATFGAGAGNADASDFDAAQSFTGTVNFADGETSRTITLAVAGDALSELNEAFTVTLSAPTGGASITTASGTGTILNDDAAPGSLAIANASVTEGNSGTTPISFTVTRSGGSDGAVAATWTATFGSGLTAADAADFTAAQAFTGTVNFANGETSQVITLNVQGDVATEQTETFTVTLSAPTGGVAIGTAAATGTITSDDILPANVFINEIHYDNSGADANEAIEIAGRAGTDLTGYSLVLYNGSNTPTAAVVYATINLSGVIDDEGAGYGALSFLATGMQNGAADGVALIAPGGAVVQFLSYEGAITAAAGTAAAGLTSTDIGVSEDGSGTALQSLQLAGNGASGTDFTWQPIATSSFGSLNSGQTIIGDNAIGQIAVNDASAIEGNSGTSNLVFTVRRAGGLATSATVDYIIALNGTADASDLAAAALLTGTVTFAVGAATASIIVPVQGDTVGEGNETFSLTLSNAVGNIAIADATATGTITNDDPVTLTIMQIQGAGHSSAYAGQPVTTTGIVTAVDTNGYYIQDASGDANSATSDGIFVFTNATAPTVAIGDSVSVTGTVNEFRGSPAALTTTQIINPTVTVLSSGNVLPTAVLIGTGGLLPPTANYEDDNYTIFDPANDAIDFYETLEGMRVTVQAPQVVGDTNSFGETWVVASGGAGATTLSSRGGITMSDGDLNPERIQIDDDSGIFAGFVPAFTIGDRLSNVTGVFNYAFESYELIVTEAVTVTLDNTLTRESTVLRGDDTHITIATYNLENLDPTDAKFDLLASDIIFRLGAPDIIGVQEIQDADGAGTGSNLSGTVTAQLLINAIIAAGGPTYAYVEVAPSTANTTGGEPNGNIRNGYFYNTARVSYVAGSAELITGSAFANSRSPLVADFEFNGLTVTVINAHSTSRGGSDPLFGEQQPPSNAGDAARLAQANAIRAYVNNELATNPNLNITVLGDFNGFYFEDSLEALTNGGVLTNVNSILPVEERYSYYFDGNLQQLDHIMVTNALAVGARYDAVHINAEFTTNAARPTDHDPQVAALFLAPVYNGDGTANNFTVTSGANWIVYGNDGDDVLAGGTGRDVIFGGIGQDELDGGANNDVLVGGIGNDRLTGGSGVNEMIGGAGDDIYVVANATDSLVEFANEGTDEVQTGLAAHTLAANIENLTLTANVSFVGIGNDLGNTIRGSASSDTLAGLDGDDQLFGGQGAANELIGGAGDDYYRVAAVGDSIIELAGGGTDTVDTELASLQLAANVEGLRYIGTGSFVGYGNDGNNVITGGTGRDTLSGGNGDDSLRGGTGDANELIGGIGDDYYASNAIGDSIFELAGEGNDRVSTELGTYVLPENVEGLIYAGSSTFVGIGNGGDNRIDGGVLDDFLSGLGGADLLVGGNGADIVLGGTGADQFFYTGTETGLDRILDFTSGEDRIALSTSGFTPTLVQEFVSGADAGAVATSANSTFLYDTNTGIVSFDADGNGAAAAVQIAQLNTGLTLTLSDFIFV